MAKSKLEREVEKNRIAELILLDVLRSIYKDRVNLIDVAGVPEYYHKGDIMAVNSDGATAFFDAKNDGVVCKSRRFFLETHKYFFSKGGMKRHTGFLEDGEYDFLCVVSQPENKIYMLNFKVLQKIHKHYKSVQSTLDDCISYGRVISIEDAVAEGALMYVIEYKKEEDKYCMKNIIKAQNVLNFAV